MVPPLSASRFAEPQVILGDAPLRWNPTGEWIFPSIVPGVVFGARALARWYLYYSPHENPGGIGLALADDLRGPWREHDSTPLITAAWPPHHAVSHVASPHALWADDERRLLLYYHGENDTTHLAISHDGVDVRYAGVAVGPAHAPALQERSYARVFSRLDARMPDPYTMLFMGRADRVRGIYVARSRDARHWQVDPEPLITPPPNLGMATSGPWLHVDGERLVVLHHIDRFLGDPARFDVRGDIYATEVSWDLCRAQAPQLLLRAADEAPDDGRAADPVLVAQDADAWLVYLAGRRLRGCICTRRWLGPPVAR